MDTPTASLPNLGESDSKVQPKLQTLSVSQGVSQGLLFKKVAPSYPQNALRMHIEGAVELVATISKDGNITQIKVVSGDPQLVRAATDAVKQWKYKPYLLNGEPVEIQTQVTVNFKLPIFDVKIAFPGVFIGIRKHHRNLRARKFLHVSKRVI